MRTQTDELFPNKNDTAEPSRRYNTGILPSQEIHNLMNSGALRADPPILADQIQPASLDLRLGALAYRVRASFLPGKGQIKAFMFNKPERDTKGAFPSSKKS